MRRIPRWKRCLDIFGAVTGLVVLSPLILSVAVYIKALSPGPVFFRQSRVGYMGQVFEMLKFRSMDLSHDPSSHREYLSDIIRSGDKGMAKQNHSSIIPFGKYLRALCLDEIPQLINVLRGEMSLVGPRPSIDYEVAEYSSWHHGRFDVLPGMTGLWQVSGKNRLTFDEMVSLDIRYVENMSFTQDVKILMKTIPAVVFEGYRSIGR